MLKSFGDYQIIKLQITLRLRDMIFIFVPYSTLYPFIKHINYWFNKAILAAASNKLIKHSAVVIAKFRISRTKSASRHRVGLVVPIVINS